jgi:aldehyde dehydrogenase (NAD+)
MPHQLTANSVQVIISKQREFFSTNQTKSIEFRLEQLKSLKRAILNYQEAILAAVASDLGRPKFEAYIEIVSLAEVNLAIKNLKKWAKPKRVATGIEQFPSSAWIEPEPLGVVLIIGPWNYPLQLMISPLVGAIASGNCAILKPSEHAPQTSKVVSELIQATFSPDYIAVCPGDVEVCKQLLAEKFDHIFYTGGTNVGREIMKAAANNLTPVTLELGGKSPCIVDFQVDLEVAAKRIAWGKFINAGQTCIAPDYILVDRQVKDELLVLLQKYIRQFYGENPANSSDYGRIINEYHFKRLTTLLDNGHVVCGGNVDAEERYIAPTLLDQVQWSDPVMQEEIFGPILPIIDYENLEQAINWVNQKSKPLALYFFSKNIAKQQLVLHSTSSGGVCLNDVVMQTAVTDLPFGGVGESGMGSYHSKASFDTFSHYKSILKKSFWLDLGWRYAPYKTKQIEQIKKIVSK